MINILRYFNLIKQSLTGLVGTNLVKSKCSTMSLQIGRFNVVIARCSSWLRQVRMQFQPF